MNQLPVDSMNPMFRLINDTDNEFSFFQTHDEYGTSLSEPIPVGESRLCILTKSEHGGAETEDGYVWVVPTRDKYQSQITALENRIEELERANA